MEITESEVYNRLSPQDWKSPDKIFEEILDEHKIPSYSISIGAIYLHLDKFEKSKLVESRHHNKRIEYKLIPYEIKNHPIKKEKDLEKQLSRA